MYGEHPANMAQKGRQIKTHAWRQQEYPNNKQKGISKHNIKSYDNKYNT